LLELNKIYCGDSLQILKTFDVWIVTTKPNSEAHFATFPPDLITPCILSGSAEHGVILDPFIGSGTTGKVSKKLNRDFVGIDLNPDYCKMAERLIEPYKNQMRIDEVGT
jgi:site-specific DNA-methyltransferase (adenine-specific)